MVTKGATRSGAPAEHQYPGARANGSGMPPLHHLGLVVRDRDRTLANFSNALGFGPTMAFEGTYETKLETGPTSFSMRGGWVWMRNTAVEVIEPLDDRSPFAAHLKAHGEGLHHLAYWVGSVRGEVEAMAQGGTSPRLIADSTGPNEIVPWCYVEGALAGSTLIELIERNPMSEQIYDDVFKAINGTIPV